MRIKRRQHHKPRKFEILGTFVRDKEESFIISGVIEDLASDFLDTLRTAAGRVSREIEDDSQASESYWVNRGTFGSDMNFGDLVCV